MNGEKKGRFGSCRTHYYSFVFGYSPATIRCCSLSLGELPLCCTCDPRGVRFPLDFLDLPLSNQIDFMLMPANEIPFQNFEMNLIG